MLAALHADTGQWTLPLTRRNTSNASKLPRAMDAKYLGFTTNFREILLFYKILRFSKATRCLDTTNFVALKQGFC